MVQSETVILRQSVKYEFYGTLSTTQYFTKEVKFTFYAWVSRDATHCQTYRKFETVQNLLAMSERVPSAKDVTRRLRVTYRHFG